MPKQWPRRTFAPWVEDPPKWDVVRRNHISKVLGGTAGLNVAVEDLARIVRLTVFAIYDKKRSLAKAMVFAAESRV